MAIDTTLAPSTEAEQPAVRWAWRLVGLAGMLGGLCLIASAAILSTDPEANAKLPQRAAISVVGLALVWVGLHGLHRLHAAANSRAETWGFGLAACGLVFGMLGSVMRPFDPLDRVASWADLMAFAGTVLVRIGFITFAVGVVRARLLPKPARTAAVTMAVALTLTTLLSPLRLDMLTLTLAAVGWLGWSLTSATLLNGGLVARAVPSGPVASLRTLGGAFVSKATIVTAAVSVGVFSLEWEWTVGLLVVVLLYAHEIGHIIAALVRGVAVHRAPFFIPGLGAFVQTDEGASHWDSAWVSLGGPLIGGVAALIVKAIGASQQSPALLQAGDIGLWLNLLNLAPFSPLDGGRIVGRTGWLGLVTTLGVGIVLFTQGVSIFILLLILFGVWQAFTAIRTLRVPWRTQFGVYGIYLGSILLLFVAGIASGRVAWERAPRPDWLPGLGDVFSFMFWSLVIGAFALPYAFSDTQSARVRYGLLTALGWTRYLLDGQHWLVPIHIALFGHTIGLPGLRLVENRIAGLAARRDARAGRAAVWAFDCLRRHGEAADAWLDQQAPALKAGGPATMAEAFLALHELGYQAVACHLLHQSLATGEFAGALPTRVVLAYAWQLHLTGEDQDALPYAQAATPATSEDPTALEPLGRILLGVGQAVAAERTLRQLLDIRTRTGARFALARALAAQGRHAEAIAEGERALSGNDGAWQDDELSADQAREQLQTWRGLEPATTSAELGLETDEPPSP